MLQVGCEEVLQVRAGRGRTRVLQDLLLHQVVSQGHR